MNPIPNRCGENYICSICITPFEQAKEGEEVADEDIICGHPPMFGQTALEDGSGLLHLLHKKCIASWLREVTAHGRCPVCRYAPERWQIWSSGNEITFEGPHEAALLVSVVNFRIEERRVGYRFFNRWEVRRRCLSDAIRDFLFIVTLICCVLAVLPLWNFVLFTIMPFGRSLASPLLCITIYMGTALPAYIATLFIMDLGLRLFSANIATPIIARQLWLTM
jgi:hypothetical protein